MRYGIWFKTPDDLNPDENESIFSKFYRWFWSRWGGRPYTFTIRDSWHKIPPFWIFFFLIIGAFMGINWKLIFGFLLGHLFWM